MKRGIGYIHDGPFWLGDNEKVVFGTMDGAFGMIEVDHHETKGRDIEIRKFKNRSNRDRSSVTRKEIRVLTKKLNNPQK